MAIITLTSDIGDQDFLTGAIKGQLLSQLQDTQIIDINHRLSPFNYPQAVYVCKNAMKHFPPGTFHLILVNLFDDEPKQLLMAYQNGQYFCCADNGLLTMILEETPNLIGLPLLQNRPMHTLDCTAEFAKAAKAIQTGKTLQEIGEKPAGFKVKNPLKLKQGDDWIEGQIIFIDHFENVIVNITKVEFEKQRNGRQFSIVFKRDEMIEKISDHYADVPDGEKLAYFNAAGYLEIAINKGNAAGLFGLQGFSERQQQAQQQINNNQLFYQTVKVFFQ